MGEVVEQHVVQVLDHGFVRLDAAMADDLSVVNAARVSFARRKDVMDESDEGLVRFLMRDRHGTPFEHNAFRFHIRCPIFVAREWFRHRIGSFNEFSMRYAKATDDFYVRPPRTSAPRWASPARTRSSPSTPISPRRPARSSQAVYSAAYAAYERLTEAGVARELARAVMPVGAYTEFFWTVNARALMNFISLRNTETAQREIRRYAEVCEGFLATAMPVTHGAFVAARARRALDRPLEVAPDGSARSGSGVPVTTTTQPEYSFRR